MEHAYWKTDHLPNYNAFSMIPKDKPTERPAGTHHTTSKPSTHSSRTLSACHTFSLTSMLLLTPVPVAVPSFPLAGWHPGPHGHELRAQILAWNYLRVLQDAIA